MIWLYLSYDSATKAFRISRSRKKNLFYPWRSSQKTSLSTCEHVRDSSEECHIRCARAPPGVCQGPLALTQRCPRSSRFAAMWVRPREVQWLRGLAEPPTSSDCAKDEEELCARVRSIGCERPGPPTGSQRTRAARSRLATWCLKHRIVGQAGEACDGIRLLSRSAWTAEGITTKVACSERVEGLDLDAGWS